MILRPSSSTFIDIFGLGFSACFLTCYCPDMALLSSTEMLAETPQKTAHLHAKPNRLAAK